MEHLCLHTTLIETAGKIAQTATDQHATMFIKLAPLRTMLCQNLAMCICAA